MATIFDFDYFGFGKQMHDKRGICFEKHTVNASKIEFKNFKTSRNYTARARHWHNETARHRRNNNFSIYGNTTTSKPKLMTNYCQKNQAIQNQLRLRIIKIARQNSNGRQKRAIRIRNLLTTNRNGRQSEFKNSSTALRAADELMVGIIVYNYSGGISDQLVPESQPIKMSPNPMLDLTPTIHEFIN